MAQLLILIAAVIGSGSMVGILAMIMRRLQRLESGDRGPGSPELLASQLNAIQVELEMMREEVTRLSDQGRFMEQLLGESSADSPPSIEPGT